MYLLSDNTGKYVKISADNKITFTSNESLADTFNSKREVIDFIRKKFPKKKRKDYKPVKCACNFPIVSDSLIDLYNNESSVAYGKCLGQPTMSLSLNSFDDVPTTIKAMIDTYLVPKIDKYTAKVKKYDGMILDIRHYIRDPKTKANACWGFMIFQAQQKLERKRAEAKKELQRFTAFKNSILKAIKEFEEFEYEEYKNRQINNIVDFINDVDSQLVE